MFTNIPRGFHPFARQAIRAFTRPGDFVLDPFCGGGTTIVEALRLGRRTAGMDISALATFLAKTKTTALSVHDKHALIAWTGHIARLRPSSFLRAPDQLLPDVPNYRRNLPKHAERFFGRVIAELDCLPTLRQQQFVRLALLSVGQWALDCRTATYSVEEMREEFCDRLLTICGDLRRFAIDASESSGLPASALARLRRIINRSSEGSEADGRLPRNWLPARLVLTSPPYPGVHVLYHRWQIHGRKETPAPFWLANQNDGAGEAHYGLGTRQERGLKTYYARLTGSFRSVMQLMDCNSLVVQLVAFSDPVEQLPLYLGAMIDAGLAETQVDCNHTQKDGRVWRHVPGRKWYASSRGRASAGNEVLLIHRRIQ